MGMFTYFKCLLQFIYSSINIKVGTNLVYFINETKYLQI